MAPQSGVILVLYIFYISYRIGTELQSLRKIKKYVKSLHKIIENWRIIANFMPKYVIL